MGDFKQLFIGHKKVENVKLFLSTQRRKCIRHPMKD